ncbi:tetratricopeptide repeat-containing sensor histidine kinase [Arenibacter sp. GZD96]|uniref:tetratricopeptide repeat-containing sensor histidine kinase n=1 Tax=Aurantibrevibacter litoralis TaxID=3106030 RepID=UPI002AFF4E11|nr:tetratricopeptide repeat-containing sensor histidine kinase [Arenibacter sp. GZD-96]MEA1786190.1 tetratricopeptide repeat-containing sensor histidine kinase [Arenibacter sp. GZD-96]
MLFLLVGFATIGMGQRNLRDSLKLQITAYKHQPAFSTKDTTFIDLLNKLSAEMRYYNSDSLRLLALEVLKYSKAATYPRGESMALLRLGDYHSDRGDREQAISHYLEAIEHAKELSNPNLQLRIQNNLSGEYGYNGDYAKALSGYLDGIELAEKVDHKLMLSIMYENIGGLYASQKDFVQALEFYKKVKKINEQIGDPINSAKSMANLASVYTQMNNHDYAMFNINSSISTFEKFHIMDWLAFAYEVKGKIYVNQEKYTWALHWYKQSEMLHQKIDDERGKIDLLNGLSEAYFGLKKDSISEGYALEAFEISTKILFLEGIRKCSKTLYKINKNKEDYATALYYHELYQKLADTLARTENSKSLSMFKTKIAHDRQQEQLILENEKALAKQQGYIKASLVMLLIVILVALLVYRNQKVQKKLNIALQAKTEDLQKNEQELKEINETKDKLFSIIAHDLRGPIGALKGLLKLFKDGEIAKDEFLDFMPKLTKDVDHISFTLNNLLSWGQSQMKGSVTKPSVTALEVLTRDNINLLAEIAKEKSIKIKNTIPENTLTWSDANQIDIVIRNLISNALKFTPTGGTILINACEVDHYWEVAVRDSGVGITYDVQQHIFSKDSNITTYGTNNEKGTGLGLGLCKEMVEKNGGRIWVKSAPQKGSCFYFTVPMAQKKYQKAG